MFKGVRVCGGGFFHAVYDFEPFWGGFHAGGGGFCGFVGAFVDGLVGLCEVAFMFIPVSPYGVVALVSLGHGFDFFFGEFFDFFCDVGACHVWDYGMV